MYFTHILDKIIKSMFNLRPEKMNKCVVIPGHAQIKIQQLTSTSESNFDSYSSVYIVK